MLWSRPHQRISFIFRTRSTGHRLVSIALVFLQILTFSPLALFSSRSAWAQGSDVIGKADELYGTAQFAEASATLRSALDGGVLEGKNRALALEYLGRCYVRLGRAAEADSVFYRLIQENPKWTADAQKLAPDEMDAFTSAQERWSRDHPTPTPVPPTPTKGPWWKNKWVIGGGTLITAGIVWALWPHTNEPPPLASPPNPPGN